MAKLSKIKKYILDSNYRWLVNNSLGLFKYVDDKAYLKQSFKVRMGYDLDLKAPKTYNEKLQWIKLNDRKEIYSTMVDKYAVKQYVAEIIGEEYIVPTIGVWEKVDDIDFNSLPEQFVLKCNHDSHGSVLCSNKNELDINAVSKYLKKCLETNYYFKHREWPYKNVSPKIICEPLIIETGKSVLTDYKVYTFNGKAKLCMINQDRDKNTKADYFDQDYNWLDFKWGYEHANNLPKKPVNYEKMFEFAEMLSKNTYTLRVDFYEINGHLLFGELTFFDGSGFDKIDPVEWDYTLGNWIKLPIDE